MINSAKSGAACALSDRLLTLPDGPGRFWPCVSRFLVKSPALKLSPPGPIHVAELHWYEAAGIGRKEFKIKHLL
jgi:hypothetical protein